MLGVAALAGEGRTDARQAGEGGQEEPFEDQRVVDVGGRCRAADRHAGAVHGGMVLGASLAAIRGVRAGRVATPLGADRAGSDDQVRIGAQHANQQRVHLCRQAGGGPARQAAAQGRAAGACCVRMRSRNMLQPLPGRGIQRLRRFCLNASRSSPHFSHAGSLRGAWPGGSGRVVVRAPARRRRRIFVGSGRAGASPRSAVLSGGVCACAVWFVSARAPRRLPDTAAGMARPNSSPPSRVGR